MGLSCACPEYDDAAWWWEGPDDYSVLKTKRSRKCHSCGERVKPGDMCLSFRRWRNPQNAYEDSRYPDEVPLAPYHYCETCGDLYWNLDELGFCLRMGDNMRKLTKQAAEYAKAKRAGETVSLEYFD